MWKYLQSLPLARTRTHALQEFLPFCCHKCHTPIIIYYISDYYASPGHILTNTDYNPPQHQRKHLKKTSISCLHFPLFLGIIFPICDTCDSKKSISLLEGAHAHVRERRTANFPPNLSPIPGKIERMEKTLSLFPWFFTHWTYFYPYCYKGTSSKTISPTIPNQNRRDAASHQSNRNVTYSKNKCPNSVPPIFLFL